MPVAAKDGLKVLQNFSSTVDGDGNIVIQKKIIAMEPGTTAASLGKAEDAAHSSGDVGIAVLAVRRDTRAVGSGSDGDYSVPGISAQGAVYVETAKKRTWLESTPTVSVSPAYAAGDNVGGLITLASAARFAGGSLVIGNIVVSILTSGLIPGMELDLVLFRDNPSGSTFNDNVAQAIVAADLAKIAAYVELGGYSKAFTANGILHYTPPAGIPIVLATGVTSLYAALVAKSAFTLGGTNHLTLGLAVTQD